MFGKIANAVRNGVEKAANFVRRNAVKIAIATGVVAPLATRADAPDASTIISTASTTFNTVGALVVSTVGFFIIVKIVKWIRK